MARTSQFRSTERLDNVVEIPDNKAMVKIINKGTSHCSFCMHLVRAITLESMKHNVKFPAVHVRTEKNGLADSVSRRDFSCFFQLDPGALRVGTPPPSLMWPPRNLHGHSSNTGDSRQHQESL